MTTVFNRLGPYEIAREVGRGGMAVVFLARDSRTDRQVALKLVPHGTDREAREILDAERYGAELQKRFSQINDHVPAVYEYGDASGYLYVAMEYLEGENLSETITRGPLEIARAVDLAIELCRFLEDAHRFEAIIEGREFRSLLHLDLKPRNIRITESGRVKVLDFGIAKALSLSRKVTRNEFGSVAYISPERLETGEVDARADFWAVGVLLYEMTSGSLPFQASDTRRLERLILSRRPPPPLMGHCPVGIEAIVAKLLAPTPAQRYDSARAIREDLERFKSGTRTGAEAEGWPTRAIDEHPTRRTHVPAAAHDEKTRRTRPAGDDPAQAVPAVAGTTGGVAPPVAAPLPAAASRGKRRFRRLFRAALLVMAFGLLANEVSVGDAANRLAGSLPTRELEEMADAWSTYELLAQRSNLGFGTDGLDQSLVERTVVLSERVIADYRMPAPTVREGHWRMARETLRRAVALRPDDRSLRAALRYCEGHLHRINGEARKARGAGADAQRELAGAITAFREAAELRPGWPDPFLGLARTFIYGLEDVDRGADAFEQAQRKGYTASERDTAQLADGYRARGNALARNARALSGMPQERDFLARAADAYRQALTLYPKAGTFANVPANIRLTQRALDQVERRLEALLLTSSDSFLVDQDSDPWA